MREFEGIGETLRNGAAERTTVLAFSWAQVQILMEAPGDAFHFFL